MPVENTIILVAAAFIIVWWNRDTMLGRDGAVTQIVPALQPEHPGGALR